MKNTNTLPTFGDKVSITRKYERTFKREKITDATLKEWVVNPYPKKDCLFLGTRTLRNGVRDFDPEEGYYFEIKETLTAALVSPGKNLNPVYAPLEDISS